MRKLVGAYFKLPPVTAGSDKLQATSSMIQEAHRHFFDLKSAKRSMVARLNAVVRH